MDDPILFSEKQRFNQWWIVMILVTINIFIISVFFVQVAGNTFSVPQPTSLLKLAFGCTVSLIVTGFVFYIRLETLIKYDGIYVRFFPLQSSYRHFKWNQIKQYYVRTYKPISEYGGWGLRWGFFGQGNAYNVTGNKGLQLEFTNGKKLLIGTQKPEELKSALHQIKGLPQGAV